MFRTLRELGSRFRVWTRPSMGSNEKIHTSQPCTRPSNDAQRRPSSTSNGRTFSMASSAMEDGDLPETPETNLGSSSCLRRDGEMCERRAGTMSWRRRRNATTWMLNLGAETKKIGLSLLRRGALHFLGLHLRIFGRHHLCHSSPLITNTHRLNLSLVLQQPACFPSQIPFIPIHCRPLLFMVPIWRV